MTRELGVQFAREGVRVNALCPGPVNTPLLKELFAKDPERAARRLVHVPMGRFGEPEEMASAVLFLASDDVVVHHREHLPGRRRDLRCLCHAALRRRPRSAADRRHHLPRAGAVGGVGHRAPTCCTRSTPTPCWPRAAYRCCSHRSPATDDVAAVVVGRIDGLVVSGGADVDPARYGEEPHPSTASWREDRDAWETALLRAADEAGLPTLGVCRGMQLMAVAAGGSLVQHTPDLVGHEEHSPGADAFGTTEVTTAEESRLRGPGRRAGRGRLPPPPVAWRPPRLRGGRVGGRRLARGDGAARARASAWPSSGTPRSRDDHSLFAALVAPLGAAARAAGRLRWRRPGSVSAAA